ncbi:hypothetical protein O7634_29930 [Micromonospora sp. WMMD1120]|uniref:effector-associated constant component EACC1 n=1 Tax=Micromonospora sp. WMMD1120 TaxID=3016106 RepID=UPI002417737D|nr:hypothetical protein [Micromonospora sp. WMMD1120]MDG4810999.1 hypothetical protein [Micromonospora sp. WMMD1120]
MEHLRIRALAPDAEDELRFLYEWLLDAPELRGRVTMEQSPPPPGRLGPVLEALLVALGPGGAVAAMTVAVISWLRHRTSDVTIRVTSADGGEVEVSAFRVRKLDEAAVRDEVDRLTRLLGRELPPDPPPQ